jgi:tetratricopeptide (TPR) repeat protein
MAAMVLVAVVLLGGCGAAVPALPSKGGPAWLELKSAHVTLWTNASARRARELINEMERRRQVVARAMGRAQQKKRIFAVALESEREALEFIEEGFAAVAWNERNPSLQPGILMRTYDFGEETTLNHELAHAVSYSIIDHQPAWVAEGLASYFETGTLEPGETSVQIGIPRRDHLVYLRQNPPVSMAELFACEGTKCRTREFYATSWAVFSYLLNQHFDRFNAYLRRLGQLPYGEHMQAWSEIFPELTAAKLDRELPGWIYAGSFAVPIIPVEVKDYPFVARKLSDADVLAVRALLYRNLNQIDKARAAAAAALALDRTHLLAWLVSVRFDVEPNAGEARAIATANAEDWRAWLMLRSVVEEGPDRDAANQRFCALAAREGNDCAEWGSLE